MSGRFWVASATALLLASPVFLWAPARAADEPKKANPPKQADNKPAAGADVFGHEKVWQFHLSLTPEEYAAMQPAQGGGFGFPGGGFPGQPPAPKVEPKPGEKKRETHRGAFGTEFPWGARLRSLSPEGKTIEKVGLRYKGNSTYMSTSRNLKRSLKVDLDKYDDAARFHGLKSLTLNCGVMDPSKTRERGSRIRIYRAAGSTCTREPLSRKSRSPCRTSTTRNTSACTRSWSMWTRTS